MKPLIVGVAGLQAGLGLQCYMFRLLPELYRIKWMCDLDEARVRRGVTDFGGTGTRNFDDLLRDPEVDLVTIATPVTTHADMAKKALAAGKHVLLEKPITATVAEADELIAQAKKSRGALCIDHQRRFQANQKIVTDVLRQNDLGHILSVRLDLAVRGVRGSEQPVDPATWNERFVRTHSYDYLVHYVDQLCLLLQEKPRQIYARYASLAGNDLPCEIEISMVMPSGILAYVGARCTHAPELKWQINGEQGSLRIQHANDMGPCLIYRVQPDGSTNIREIQRVYLTTTIDGEIGAWRPKKDPEIHGGTDQDAHIDFYQHLFMALTRGTAVPVSPEDARDAIKIIWLAVESAKTGRVVDWT